MKEEDLREAKRQVILLSDDWNYINHLEEDLVDEEIKYLYKQLNLRKKEEKVLKVGKAVKGGQEEIGESENNSLKEIDEIDDGRIEY